MNEEPIYVNEDLFLGRTEEQKEFRRILPEVIAPPRGEELPYVVLLYGGGGMGKTTLARRFKVIAITEPLFEGTCETLWIDWEEERNKHTPLQVGREHIRPEVVFERIHVAATQEGWGRHFRKYQKILKERGKVEQMAAKALTSRSEQDELGRQLAQVGTTSIAKLIRFGLPRIGDTGEAIARTVLGAGVQIGAEGLEQAKTRLKAELDNDQYQLFLNPEEQMSLALAEGLGRVAKNKPLLIFFDTYEIIDHADIWVREVIKAAGARLLWVIAGRQDLAQSRQFGNVYFRGYRETFPRRLLAYNMPQLAQDDLRAFFADVAPDRPLTNEQAATISQATRGIPLAIKTAAEVWQRGVSIEELVGNLTTATPHSDIVSHMTARYLLHVVNDEEDRQDLYALALARGNIDVLTAMMRPEDEAVTFHLPPRLATLSRRYAAVQLSETRLHDEPAAFLTAYLREPMQRNSAAIKQINERAAVALRLHLAELEEDMPQLEDRLGNDGWVRTALALTQTLFWLKEGDAWKWLIPRYVEGMAYSRDLRRGLLEVAIEWKEYLTDTDRLKIVQAAENTSIWQDTEPEEEMLKILGKAPATNWLSGEKEAERHAILELRKGTLLYQKKRYAEAVHAYEKAEVGLPKGGRQLQERLGEAMDNIANQLMWPSDRSDAIYNADAARLLTKVVTWLPDKQEAWYRLGVAHWKSDRFGDAIHAYKKAIKLEPNFAAPHNGLGNVYHDNGRFKEAIHAFKKAIKLEPKSPYPHNGLGNVYDDSGHYNKAIYAYKKAIKLDPKYAAPHMGLGNMYHQCGRFDDAFIAFNKAITLEPTFNDAHYGLALLYRTKGDFKRAISTCQQIIATEPDNELAQNGLGYLYIQTNDLKQAELHLNKAIEIKEGFLNFLNLGIVKWRQSEIPYALANFEEAMDILNDAPDSESTNQESVVAQGWLQVVTGNKAHGLDMLRTSLLQKQDSNDLSNLRDWSKGLLLAEQPPDGLDDILALVDEFEN